MSEQEQEQEQTPDEQTPEPEEVEEEGGEPEQTEPPAEAPPEGEPAAIRDDVDAEAVYAKLDTRSKNYVKSVGEIIEGAPIPAVLCELCSDAYPGLRWETPSDDLHAKLIGVVTEHEHGAPLKDDPNAQICATCDGFGVVKLPSHVPNNQMRTCSSCNGVGWQQLNAQSGTPQPPVPAAPNGEAEPMPGLPLDDPRISTLRGEGFTVIPPMQPLEAG